MFKIDEDEHEEEVLRRDRQSLYQLESMRAFEKAFGIDRLEKVIQEVKSKRTVSFNLDPQILAKPIVQDTICKSCLLPSPAFLKRIIIF